MEDLVERRRSSKYSGSQRDALLASDGDHNLFKNVKSYKSTERQKPFEVQCLLPELFDKEVVIELSKHFSSISCKFEPLLTHEIPVTYDKPQPMLLPYQVAGRIRAFKKPKSMVKGDIFPALMTKFGDFLALPSAASTMKLRFPRFGPWFGSGNLLPLY